MLGAGGMEDTVSKISSHPLLLKNLHSRLPEEKYYYKLMAEQITEQRQFHKQKLQKVGLVKIINV